ncbi:MAG TPA: hypothetical protein VK972_03975, partial [Wenzhouxiangella sp.]|nr:hypothetical protein [Wenzhouxiangella sp.]
GIKGLGKVDKIYLDNTNLIYILASDNANVGNIRETFFFNQLLVKHDVIVSPVADFLVGEYTFENPSSYGASQCVSVSGYTGLVSLGAHVLVNQAFGNPPQVTARATFHSQPACAGTQTGQVELTESIAHSGGQWQQMFQRLAELPAGSVSARVEYAVEADGSAPVDIWLDRLLLRFGAADVIYRNRFSPEIY